MLVSDVPPVGGIGYVVPVGGLEITGVLLEFGSVPLQAASNARPQANPNKRILLAVIILDSSSFSAVLWHPLAWLTILTLNPFPEINKLTAFRTEGTERIVFPLDWFTAGWTLHEIVTPRNAVQLTKETRVV